MAPLQQLALALVLATVAAAREKGSAGGVLEHLADALVGLGRALEVLVGTDLLADLLTLLHQRSANVPTHDAAALTSLQSRCPRSGTRRIGGMLTSSGDTGFWLVFRSSSMVFWS